MSLVPYRQDPEVERQVLDELLGRASAPVGTTVQEGLLIDDLPDRWVAHGVMYRNDVVDVHVSKVLLDGGSSRSQDGWVQFYQANGFWRPGCGQLQFALHDALLRNKDCIEQRQKVFFDGLVAVLRDDFDSNKPYKMSITRVGYVATGLDEVIHNYGYLDTFSVRKRIVGPDGCLGAGCEDVVEGLFGTRDMNQVNKVYTWLTGKKARLYRLNSTPTQRTERVLVLGCIDDNFNIYANGNVNVSRPARGLVAVRAQKLHRK